MDWSDILVASFVANANEKLNSELRIDRMIQTVGNTVTQQCAILPDNWLEIDFIKIANNTTPTGWIPIRYRPRDEFFRLPNMPYSGRSPDNHRSTFGFYTIEGRSIFFGGPPDSINGIQFQMDYYAEVPVFSDTVTSWVYTKYPALYRCCALMHADLHAVGEETQAGMLKQLAEDMITKLNADHQRARASGSMLARGRVRSFG